MPVAKHVSLPVATNAHGCERSAPHADEFPRGLFDATLSRRGALRTMGAALAMAGLTGCSDRPDEPIVPYVEQPEQVIPGEPNFFATALTRGGYARGVLVTSREGRPVKIEGNPDHPASLGAADSITQAAVLSLYDPLRSSQVTEAGQATTWGDFKKSLAAQLASHADDGGAGLAVLTGTTTSPTLAALFADVAKKFPRSAWHAHEPLGRHTARVHSGGVAYEPVLDLTDAQTIVAFDADFLWDGPGGLAYARQFADGRRVAGGRTTMNRLYVAEADHSLTGTRADHRLAAPPSRVAVLLQALAVQVGAVKLPMPRGLTNAEADWLSAVATDLDRNRGRGVVIVGDGQSAEAHALARHVNAHFGNAGRTVRFVRSPVLSPDAADGPASLARLVDDLKADRVRTLLVLGGNPVRTVPADLPLAAELARLSTQPGTFTAHVGLYADETGFNCRWHVPMQHELEQWSDAAAHDGTVSLVQPLIAPLTGGVSAVDVVNAVLGSEKTAYDTLRGYWQNRQKLDDARAFEAWWAGALQRGTVEGTAADALPVDAVLAASTPVEMPSSPRGVEVVFRPDYSVYDGSGFHNAWQQELPRPLTKIVWGNAALVSPETARRNNLTTGDAVALEAGGRRVEIPVAVVPGVADDVAVLHLGYGQHPLYGGDAAWLPSNVKHGTDVYPLRTTGTLGHGGRVTLTPLGRREDVVRTHGHHTLAAGAGADPTVSRPLEPDVIATPESGDANLKLHNRKLIRTATLAQFAKEPDFAAKMDEGEIKQLYPAWDYSRGPQWGMTIDLTACIGCNACVVACQAENNIPTVGPLEVAREREMHWLRVDTYFDESAKAHHQPVPCMHCENAPCEYVCPVAATTHSVEGLNQMTYNRCVGTRYCSNNCPYKVRRFNFLNYTWYKPEAEKMVKNPDVTVRARGVMEKCTYCVQRLNYGQRKTEIAVLNNGAEPEGELQHAMLGRVQTACQQTCPTSAIHFGDLTDPATPVAKEKKGPLNYGILVELSTKPRTTYLASITNPNPSLAATGGGA